MNFEQNPDILLLTQNRRARQLAYAILQRAKDAGIPKDFLRIDVSSFANILCPNYHNGKTGIKELANRIYNNQDNVLKSKYILIDGGGEIPVVRKKAGFAILFLMLAYDLRGSYIDCESLVHKFQTINSTNEINRNDLAEEYKSYDVLFISEFDRKHFSPHFESASFFDEVLDYRYDRSKPTIISFVNPIENKDSKPNLQNAAEGKLDRSSGKYLSALSFGENSEQDALRIRVRV